jgi:hypothetical protein
MRKPGWGDWAWMAILAYELFCPPGEMLSESLDRKLDRLPRLTEALIVYCALHCANRLPSRLDMFHQTARVLGRVERELS